MPLVDLPYVDAALDHLDGGGSAVFWHHLHWGLFADPDVEDDSPERYYAAAEALTGRILVAAEVADGHRVLDVGCGFGGTLDYLATHHPHSRVAGLNIDLRQLAWARRLMTAAPIGFVAGDGCRLPVPAGKLDHVLAIECLFHFPSRRAFFREAARVLRPGGTLGLSDFLVAPGSLAAVTAQVEALGLGGGWYGHSGRPLTSEGYAKLGRSAGFELIVDEDVTRLTLPTYPARRRLYRESGAADGIRTIGAVEELARGGDWQYHVLAFRRQRGDA